MTENFLDLWNFVPKPLTERLAWLNKPTPKELENLIGLGLKRYEFQITKDKNYSSLTKQLRSSYLAQ